MKSVKTKSGHIELIRYSSIAAPDVFKITESGIESNQVMYLGEKDMASLIKCMSKLFGGSKK